MKLNHLSLAVTDVEATRDFLEKYFGLRRLSGGKNMSFLSDEDGLVMGLFKAREHDSYPGVFHFGFIRPDRRDVDEINARLKADGYDVPEPSRQHGSWTFYFRPPGERFTIEVQAA